LFGASRGLSPDSASPQYTTLSRFIFNKKHFSKAKGVPKPEAFLPPPNLKMSASGIDGLADGQIWQIGDEAGKSRNKPAFARADFKADAVRDVAVHSVQLTIEPDPQPHDPMHVNVCGWPPDKDLRISIAQDLCAKSMLQIRPEPSG
jgi:hypothetical protein